MDDRLLDEFLANTIIGSMSLALAIILTLRHQTRGDLAMALSWFFAGVLVIVTPLLAGQGEGRIVERLYVIPLMGLYVSTPVYIRHLVITSTATARARSVVTVTALVGSVVGLSGYVLALIYPERFLNRFVYSLDSEALSSGDFWLFGTPLLASSLVLMISWTTLAQQDLDAGERTRAGVYSVAVVPLVLSLVLPLTASVIAYSCAFTLSVYGIISYWSAQGERAAFLSRFLSPQVVDLVRRRGLTSVMQPQELRLSVVSVDFRGFTSYTEAIPSQAVIELLRDYHEAIAGAVAEHDGMIKDYAGDGIMILVGAPISREDHQTAAVALASAALRAASRVTERWATDPHPLGVGIGIASGRVTVGAIGETAQMEYTCVGTPVNLAARLCSLAEDGTILLDDRVAAALAEDQVLHRGEVVVKGLTNPVTVYELKSDSEARAVAGEPLA